jgi:adenine phosphoribosyltransferase
LTLEGARLDIRALIRTIPDYPKPGVMFRDITTLLKDPDGLRCTLDALLQTCDGARIDKVVGIESRGFIVAAPLAHALRAGFVPVRKKGKLPGQTIGQDYVLEYGSDRVEMHVDAIAPGERALLVDDLLATGGTAGAAGQLIEQAGGSVVRCCFVIELPELGGRARLEHLGYEVRALVAFEGH